MNSPLIAWHKALSWSFELLLGVNTRGFVDRPTHEGVHYTPLPYPMIFRMLNQLRMQPHDVFVDIGCGKGRVICCASRLPIRKVVALEVNRDLLEIALYNTARMRGRRAPVDPVQRSAEEYDYADATVIYLYNPFNLRITASVIDRLFISYSKHPRPMRVVYANPVHEAALQGQSWLEKYEEWPASEFPVFGYPVSFWRTPEVSGRTNSH